MSMDNNMELNGGYGVPYDPWPALGRLNTSRDEALDELWENLYHQGDVGLASYAAVPELVKAGELSLVAAIEVARQNGNNPELPESMAQEYEQGLKDALISIPTDEEQYQGYYAIHASVNGQYRLAKALDLLSVEEILAEYG